MKNSSNIRLQFSTSILALLCCCAAMMFSSCSKKAGNAIVGKWEVQGQKATVEFKPDGTMINSEGDGMQNGKYSFSDATHMKMEIALPKGEMPPGMKMPDSVAVDCVVTINGDDMDMQMSMMIPGETNAIPTQSVHMKRIK